MQFDVLDLEEYDVISFIIMLQNDVFSLKLDIVYIQQMKQSVFLEEIGFRMKGLGYEGYEQRVMLEFKQVIYFCFNFFCGLYGSLVVINVVMIG